MEKVYQHVSSRASQGPGWLFLETAGGVHSPGPSGTPQADLYTPLRAPVILVGDSKLGGISQTIAAYESLKIRGHDVETVLLFSDSQYENHRYLEEYFAKHAGITVETVPEPPTRVEDPRAETEQMTSYYENLTSEESITKVLHTLDQRSKQRIERLGSMSKKAIDTIWYPFTQQKLLNADAIAVIDSAHGDHFQVFNKDANTLLQPAFDGSASWWTQGLGHANPRLTLAAAYAAGRYGHVMFAEAIHEPALALAELLLKGMENPRLSRVFYSDNGSTGCEVATKMALRAARLRYGWGPDEKLDILGLKGSYHGDTIGAMDCSEPCVYNEKIEWYQGKGYWFDYPTIQCVQGKWIVDAPAVLKKELGDGNVLGSMSEVFDMDTRVKSDEYQKYEDYIISVLKRLKAAGRKFGGLMMEPVVLGAGGMILV